MQQILYFQYSYPPPKKKNPTKNKKINYRWVHGNFPMSIHLCTTNNLYRSLHPPSPPQKTAEKTPIIAGCIEVSH